MRRAQRVRRSIESMAVAPNGSFLALGLRQHGRVRRRRAPRAARRSIPPPVLESASGGDLAKLPAATLPRYAGSTATTSATLRVLVTRTAAARYSVTRYSEPGPMCAIYVVRAERFFLYHPLGEKFD